MILHKDLKSIIGGSKNFELDQNIKTIEIILNKLMYILV